MFALRKRRVPAYVQGMTDRPSALRQRIDSRLGLTGGIDPNSSARAITVPPVVLALAGLIALVSLVGFLPLPFGRRVELALAFIPVRFAAGLHGHATAAQTVVPLFGHVFVHGNLPHLLLNSLWLLVFGTGVARRLGTEGKPGLRRSWNRGLFLAFFFASGAAGALFYTLLNGRSAILLVGASGAISGLMAGAMLFALRPFAPYGPEHGPLSRLTARPVVAASVVYVGFNLATALGAGGVFGSSLTIAWEAHIGGYLFGLLVFPIVDASARPPAKPPANPPARPNPFAG